MKQQEGRAWAGRLKALASKYKFVLLVIAAGVVLLLLPPAGEGEEEAPAQEAAVQTDSDPFSPENLERRLEEALSRVEGAGEVDVVLSVKSGARSILAQDGQTSQREGEVDSATSTVVITNGDRGEETVALQQLSPQYQGALVVCSGGDDPAVRLRLSEAVCALTGLGADKISICKGK